MVSAFSTRKIKKFPVYFLVGRESCEEQRQTASPLPVTFSGATPVQGEYA
jgi:hypothetical protein